MIYDTNSVQETQDKIYLHVAKVITDKNGFIYNSRVLDQIAIGNVVRLSFEVDCEDLDYWTHDAPYVKIIMKNMDEYMVGDVQNINRIANTNSYPLMVGERIWFKLENIIEIPSDLYGNTADFDKFITEDYVPATGPLYTIKDSDTYSCNDSSSSVKSSGTSSERYSTCSDSN